MSDDSPRAGIIDRRVEEICAKIMADTVTPEERAEMQRLMDERIALSTIDLSSYHPTPTQ